MLLLTVIKISHEKVLLSESTVVPTKSDSDVIFCLQLLSKNINLYTPLALTRIYRSVVF